MGKYRVAYATGSRADYGIVKNFLRLLDNDKDIEFSVLVTGSHLEDKLANYEDVPQNMMSASIWANNVGTL